MDGKERTSGSFYYRKADKRAKTVYLLALALMTHIVWGDNTFQKRIIPGNRSSTTLLMND